MKVYVEASKHSNVKNYYRDILKKISSVEFDCKFQKIYLILLKVDYIDKQEHNVYEYPILYLNRIELSSYKKISNDYSYGRSVSTAVRHCRIDKTCGFHIEGKVADYYMDIFREVNVFKFLITLWFMIHLSFRLEDSLPDNIGSLAKDSDLRSSPISTT